MGPKGAPCHLQIPTGLLPKKVKLKHLTEPRNQKNCSPAPLRVGTASWILPPALPFLPQPSWIYNGLGQDRNSLPPVNLWKL